METMIGRFLGTLGRNSFEAGVLVLVVLLAQWVFGKRIAPRWRCALWLLVMARLLLPVSAGSAVSLFNLFPHAQHTQHKVQSWPVLQTSKQGAVHSSLTVPTAETVQTEMPPVVSQNPTSISETAISSLPADPKTATKPAIAAAAPAKISWPSILFAVWLAGFLFFGGYVFLGSLRIRRRFAKLEPVANTNVPALLQDCRKQLGVRSELSLAESPDIATPALYGFLKPKLLLPRGFAGQFSARELRFILLHELAHVKRRDILFNWLAAALQILHWFNPLIWFGFARWRADRELACDALALETAGAGQNQEYGRTILRLLENFTHRAAVPGLVGILEDKKQLQRRIRMIANFVPNRRWPLLALLLVGVLAVVGLTDAQNHVSGLKPPEDDSTAGATGAGTLFQPVAVTSRPVVTNGPTMRVTVLDALTGQPLANAEVLAPNEAAFFNGSENAPQWLTDTNGVAIIHLGAVPTNHLKQQSWLTLSVRHESYAPHGFSWSAENKDVRPSLPESITVRLEHGLTAGGFVRDEHGTPLEGIRVRIFGSDYWPGLRHEYSEYWSDSAGTSPITTDAAGHWQVNDFPSNLDVVRISLIRPDGSVQRFVQQGETDPREEGEPVNLTDLKANRAVFVLDSGVDVRGVVVDPEGKPLPGVRIEAGYGTVNIMRAGWVRSDSAGRFDLPHRPSRQLILTADAPDFAITSMVVDVRSNMPEVRLQMAPLRPVHIQVLDGNGRAIAGAKVIAYPIHIEGQMLNFEGVTGTEGLLTWTNAPVSDFALLATAPSGKVSQELLLTPQDGQAVFRLRNGMENEILIHGQAHDAKTGEPVKLESVSYQTGDQEGFRWQADIQDTGFELTIPQTRFRPQGMYPTFQLKLEAKGYRTLFTPWRDFVEGDWKADLAMQPAQTASGKVLLPDGSPAGGAQFWISLDPSGGEVICEAPNRYWGPHLIQMRADDEGNFTLPQLPEERAVLFAHPAGYLKTSMAEIGLHPEVHLRPWSSVQGILKIGGQPKGGVRIGLGNLVFSPTGGFDVLYSSSTAPDGSFSFSNVPPGEYKLYRELAERSGQPVVEDHLMPIVIRPGEVLKVDYSNAGRAVIGQAVPDNPGLAVDWLNGSQTLTLKQNEPRVPQPAIQNYATTKAFYAAMHAYYDSPERLEQARVARTYSLVFQPDGTFRADDIPPGTYELQITLTKTNQSQQYSPFPNPADELGSLTREVVVPPGNTPFDLGTLAVHLNGNATMKQADPVNLDAQTLDGRRLTLAQFRGKYVVLAFWTAWSDRSADELKELQKLRTNLKGDARVAFLDVSLDGDPGAAVRAVNSRGYQWTQATVESTNLAAVSATFGVSSLPVIDLIDPDGRVIASNLSGERLAAAVQRVLQEKTKD